MHGNACGWLLLQTSSDSGDDLWKRQIRHGAQRATQRQQITE